MSSAGLSILPCAISIFGFGDFVRVQVSAAFFIAGKMTMSTVFRRHICMSFLFKKM